LKTTRHLGFLGRLAQAIAALTVAGVTGFISLVLLFSDPPPGGAAQQFATAFVAIFVGGLFIGFLYPERWWIAGLTAWGGFLLSAPLLVVPLQFRNAQRVRVVITDGKIVASPSTIMSDKLRLELRNNGTITHEIGIFHPASDSLLHQLRQGTFNLDHLDVSWRPISPGESDVTYIWEFLDVAGQYAFVCLLETESGLHHSAQGEMAEFTVK
jgi:hypothetical protein